MQISRARASGRRPRWNHPQEEVMAEVKVPFYGHVRQYHNLKAELEIRQINAKLDELLTRQWQRLLEIQQIQTELMEEITRSAGEKHS
jgi:hypothetical protein